MPEDQAPTPQPAAPPEPPIQRTVETFEKARRGSVQVQAEAPPLLPPGGLTEIPQALIGVPSPAAQAPPAADSGNSGE